MSNAYFQARFDISSVVTISATEWEIMAEVFDSSNYNYNPADVQVDDIFFDEDVSTSVVNRWKVLSIVSTGTPNVESIVLRCGYDEDGTPSGVGQPIPSQGMICRPTGFISLSQRASIGYAQISETIKNAILNIDLQKIDKKIEQKSNESTFDENAIHTDVSGEILSLPAKTVIADNDAFVTEDSIDSGDKKKILWSTIVADMKAYFDTLYAAISSVIQSDWNQSINTEPDFIKNKPIIGTSASKDVGLNVGNLVELNALGEFPTSVLPELSISEFIDNFVDLATALLDSNVQASQRGDWFTIDTNGGESYIVTSDFPTTVSDVTKIKTPTTGVTSVDGLTGAVDLSSSYEPKNVNIQLHISSTNNPHNVSMSDLDPGTLAELNAQITDATLAGVTNIGHFRKLTQAEYDAITPVDSTIYFIVG